MISRIAAAAIVVSLIAAGCGDDGIATTTSTTAATTSSTTSTSTTTTAGTTSSTEVTTTTTTAATGTTSGGGAQAVSPELADLVAATERVRGLPFLSAPTITQLQPDEFAARVRTEFDEDLDREELAVVGELYRVLGILDPSIDLADAYVDLYSEQVAGFYDHEAKELVVPTGSEISPLFKTVIVHELIHALQDQHFGYGDILDTLADEERYEEAFALLALLEGDATYFQLVYLQELPVDEQLSVITESLEQDTTVLDSLPSWFGEDLYFPYDQGFLFAERLVGDGGTATLNGAYDRPPTTTEQILHPGKWFNLEGARPVTLPETPVPGYETFVTGVFGEWLTSLILLDGVSDGEAVVASAGWGGDHYRLLWDESEVALVLRYEGDTPRDAEELEAALVASLDARMDVGAPLVDEEAGTTTFTGGDYAFVDRDGATLTLVVAGDPTVGASLAEVMAVG